MPKLDLKEIRATAQALIDASVADEAADRSGATGVALSAAGDAYDALVTPDVVVALVDEIDRLRGDDASTESSLGDYDHLSCPVCERVTPPHKLKLDGSAVYRCHEHGHRITWRIGPDGTMYRGEFSRRAY